MLVVLVSLASAQSSCVDGLVDVFPDDGASLPADAQVQIVTRPDCAFDATQAEILDAEGEVFDLLPRFVGREVDWAPVLPVPGTYTLRIAASDSATVVTRGFQLTSDPASTPEPPGLSRFTASRLADEADGVVSLQVSSSGDPNLRVHVLTTEGVLLDVVPVTAESMPLQVAFPDIGDDICVRVGLRDPTDAVREAEAVCTAVQVDELSSELPQGCATVRAPGSALLAWRWLSRR